MVFYKLATDFINHHIYMAITIADWNKEKTRFLDVLRRNGSIKHFM